MKPLAWLALSVLLSAVLGSRVFTDFEPTRAIFVRAPVTAATGTLELDVRTSSAASELAPPFALIARLDGRQPGALYRFELDGKAVCDKTIGAGRAIRVDCVVTGATAARTLRITGSEPGWTLRYLELSTHHGSSSGLFKAFVLPRAREFAGVSAARAVAAAVALAAFLIVPGLPGASLSRGRMRGSHLAISGLVIVALALILVAPWISPFQVVIAPRTWALSVLILAAPRLADIARRASTATSPRMRRSAVAVAVTMIVGAAGAHVVRQTASSYYGGNISGLVQIAQSRFDAHPALRERDDLRASLVLHEGTGYDAQFMYFAAFDPWLRSLPDPVGHRAFIDAPPYRYPRAGFVWMTKLVSLGDERRYAAAMVWLGVAGFAAAAAALSAIAIHAGSSPLWGLAVLAIPGMWRSLTLAMPEPVAAALVTLAVLCLMSDRVRAAAVCFAAAVLVRETTAILLLVAVAFAWRAGKRRKAAVLLLALAPYGIWRLYVGWMLFPDWGMQAFFFNPHAYDLPMKPIAELFAFGSPYLNRGVARASLWFAGLLVVAAGAALALARSRAAFITAAAAVYGVMSLALDRDIIWTHVSNVERTTYEMFLMLAIAGAVSAPRARRQRWGLVALLAAGALYVLFLGHDAAFMRRTLLGL